MIYTIFTGGTIGSTQSSDGGVSPDSATGINLIDRYLAVGETDIEFKTSSPINILSENLNSGHILTIAHEIEEALTLPDLQGILLTHGTDTLQYTAAVLSYIFPNIQIPIVMVSSNYVLDDPRANGLINFYFAVRFIKDRPGTGVFVSYCNDGEQPTIHRGNRLGNPVVFSDYIYSVRGQYYGSYDCDPTDSATWKDAPYVPCKSYSVDPDDKPVMTNGKGYTLTETASGILKVYAAPGIVYPHIPDMTQAILLHSYHSGTLCLDERMIDFLEEAHGRDIPVFLLGLARDAIQYESMKPYDEYGIIPIYDCAPIAQYCKLWILMSSGYDFVEKMLQPYSSER